MYTEAPGFRRAPRVNTQVENKHIAVTYPQSSTVSLRRSWQMRHTVASSALLSAAARDSARVSASLASGACARPVSYLSLMCLSNHLTHTTKCADVKPQCGRV